MNTRRHDPNDSEDKVLEAAAARRRSCMEGLAAKLLGVPFGSGDLAAAVMEAGNGLAEAGLTPSRVNLAILTIAPSLDGVGLRWMRAAPVWSTSSTALGASSTRLSTATARSRW